ncbi:MAG: radical SAM family heme chaperone HemW [Phycisphaerae bacterium]
MSGYDTGMTAGLKGTNPAPATPCGLYVHIPFCEAKCAYCDFFSVAVKDRNTEALMRRVARELRIRLADNPDKISTVFFGGGTPTILPLEVLAALLEAVERSVPISELAEFTVEANPATVDDEKARLLVASGVSRVSMGAQSFFASELATLERVHSPDDIAPSVAILRHNGIQQVNLDLIFGIPGQTLDTWSESLRRAIDLEPDHIACYGLTYEPGTRLTAQRQEGRVTPCDEQLEADMFLHAIDTLEAAGYGQYETSNFARPGCRCRHNLIYWHNEPYIGVGPSAAGYINGRRYKNVADVDAYIRMIDKLGHAEAESEIVDTQMLMTEMIMMQLRLVEGLSIASFRQRTGADPLTLFADVLAQLTDLAFVTVSDTHIALTRQGRLLSDAVMAELVAACGE